MHAGDHILVTDSAYGPTRAFCDQILTRLGVTTTYYDPLIGGAIAGLMQPNTRAVFTESPGSLSFEMQDVPAIAEAAHAKGALVLMDNTWATPLYFRALDFGVDLSIHAGTKYFGGHSDVMLGTVAANSATIAGLRNFVRLNGLHVGPDDVYLGQRGLRTLAVRLDRHQESGAGRWRAGWSSGRKSCGSCIRRCRAIPATRCGSAISAARRDCSAWCSSRCRRRRSTRSSIRCELFGIGASWGGYESLAIPFDCTSLRTATRWAPGGPTVRFHIGLEAVEDLIADLERGFAALADAARS